MNNLVVCVDASFLIKLVLPEPFSEQADVLWEGWTQQGVHKVAPRLLRYEATSVLRKSVHRRLLTDGEADDAFRQAMSLRVELLDPADLHERAWEMARRLAQPTAYDSHYLALAGLLDCRFWTGDERLFNAVHPVLDWVSWVGRSDEPA